MFADSVCDDKFSLLAKEFGWKPAPHSIEEVDAMVKRLATAWETDAKGRMFQTRALTKAEDRFVANERLMCSASCGYFLTRYYWIKAKNKILRFAFRSGQTLVWKILQELDVAGVSKELQVLKARKLGISTLAEGIATWGSLFVPGVTAQIGSADGQKTQIMLGMMTLAIEQLPVWLPPTQTRSKTASDRGMLEFSRIGSLIMVQPGSMMGGMGQGATPTLIHLSECSQFSNPVVQLDEGLFKAVESSPEVIFILESTGDASHRSSWWWKEQWMANRDNYWSGGARFLPVFLPWHTTPELYPGEHWMKKYPMPEDFRINGPNEDTIAHVRRAEAYVRNTEMMKRLMGANWTMPLEQQWYWQFNHEDHKRRRVEKSWYRQMPCDDYEALLGEHDKVYSQDAIDVVTSSVAKPEETQVFMLAGDGVEKKREPDESLVWYGQSSPPRLRCHWNTRKERLDWMFVPLKPITGKFDPLEKFLIWEEPREGFDYSIGIDTGTGVGGDRSVINVTRYGCDDEPDVQVAEFASDSIPTAEIYAWISAAASLYGCYMKDKPHPKLSIEMKRKFGDLPYHQLRGMGFRRWHEWGQGFDRKTFDEKVGKRGRIGWFTNEWSRPMLLSSFQHAVENGWYTVRSKWLAEELADVEQRTTVSGKTRVDHAAGKHDDRLFAAAMAHWTLHQKDVMAERAKRRYDMPEKNQMIIERGPVAITATHAEGKLWLQSR
jgi:hypothetical protein